jgi:hypothetical protein
MPFRPGRTACAMLHNEHVLYVSMCDDDARDGVVIVRGHGGEDRRG